MDNPNIGLLFYKCYYKKIKAENIEGEISFSISELTKTNKNILGQNQTLNPKSRKYVNQTIDVETNYPGLLIGSGYNHEVGGIKEELKLGFFFDYTTGLPCIPGSSVKGVLRSVFPERYKNENDKNARVGYLNELFDSLGIPELTYGQIKNLELEIFEGKDFSNNKNEYLSIYKRDTFFDAFPIATGEKNKLFYDDYITPHIDKDNPKLSALKNPKPLRFLKVAPQVKFQFGFKLFDSKAVKSFTKEKKKKLFEFILKDFGIGAKTNVGYGQFE